MKEAVLGLHRGVLSEASPHSCQLHLHLQSHIPLLTYTSQRPDRFSIEVLALPAPAAVKHATATRHP